MLDILFEATSVVQPIDQIRTATIERIEHFLQSPKDVRVYADLRGLCTAVSISYRNRAVFELLQNAHDAHLVGETSGRIRFVLKDEGPHGALYVANDGLGFTGDNFTALCSPTRTTKTVNEAIGNKGVGFLSVFQICAHPEVYSRPLPTRSAEFDGYCFGFADVHQLRAFLEPEGLADNATRIAENMPQLYLAVPAQNPPPLVRSLGEDGYATVLRLPLKNDEARSAVEAQLSALATGEPEVQLFLDRISELKLEFAGHNHVLRRDSRTVYEAQELVLHQVSCGSRNYIVARRALPETVIRELIAVDIAAEALPESWSDWKGDAVVSLAVTASGEPIKGRLYTFLPMGEGAEAPLAGHLDAPFFATIERKNLEEGGTLNPYLMQQCRLLALDAAVAAKAVLGDETARHVVADFLFWTGNGASDIRAALLESGDLLVPAESQHGKAAWSSLDSVRLWEGGDFFTAKRVSGSVPFSIADGRLGAARIANLRKLAGSVVGLSVAMDQKVAMAVAVARDLHRAGSSISDWNRFYAALPELLPNAGARLQGQPILLTDRNELVVAEAPSARDPAKGRRRLSTVFLPPLRSASGSLSLPTVVQRRMTYLNGALECVLDGANLGRKFLIGANLVREYDRREILRVMAGVIVDPGQAKDPDLARWEALNAILSICTGEGGSLSEASEIGLRVPTRDGWIRATEAFFGDWPGTRSSELDELFEKAAPVSEELQALSQLRLLPYPNWNVPPGRRDAWIAFLKEAGVRDHLRPLPAFQGQPPRGFGNMLVSILAGRSLMVTDRQKVAWVQRIRGQASLPNPLTEYTVRDAWRFPGQADYADIAPVAGEAYAIQLVRMLETFPGIEYMAVFRPNHPHAPNTRSWPSPAEAFLATENWVPTTGEVRLPLHRSWLPASTETPPAQAPLVSHPVRLTVERSEHARGILMRLGLSVFGQPASAWRLLMQAADWSNTSTQPLDRLWSLTQDAWGQADLSKALPEGMQLLARVDGEIVAFDPRAEKRPIYIADTDDRSMTGALSRVARGVIVFEPPLARAKEVATYLCAQIPDGLQRMSEMRVVYQTSQGAFVYDAADPLLEQDIAADVRTFVLLTVRYRCKFVSASPDKIVGKLSTLRIRWVDELHLQVGDHSLPLPSFQHSAVLVSSGGGDTILAPKMTKGSDRELLVLAPALGEVVGSRLLASDALYAVAARMLQTGKGATAQGLAEALDLAHDDVLAAMQDSRTIIGALLHVTRPFIRLWCGPPAMEELLDKHRPTNEADLIAASDNHSAIPVSGRRLVEACRSGSVENAALDLHVDLAALNAVLQELGAPYRPIDRTAHHEEAFGRYLLRQQARIRESIREAYRDDFMAGDLSHYVTARDAPAPIVPAGTGLCLLRSESTDWASWLMDWLAKGGVSALVEVPEARATLEVVRETNQKFLKALAPTARLLVIKKAETEAAVAQTWRDPEGLEGRLLAIASAQGWTDFDRLDETAILTWLARARLWPEDWPKSLVASDHGLTAEDLDALREAERKARQALITPPRMLEFTGGQYIVGETSLASLTDHIAELVNDNAALLASSSNTMKGKPIVLPKRTSGGTGGGGGYGSGTDRMTDEEKSVIGYFGEIIAFGWLKAKFGRNRVIDHGCWKSNYRRHACGEPGDDSLGYDFEIASGKATWFFEVKATASADPRDCRMIELGSTEVAKAEVCRAENRLHYRILHVVNALKPDQASLRVLPNPRSEEGKAFYTEQMTAGVRLYFPPQ